MEFIILFSAGVIIGGVLAWLIKPVPKSNADTRPFLDKIDNLNKENGILRGKLELLADFDRQFTDKFKNISTEIIAAQTKRSGEIVVAPALDKMEKIQKAFNDKIEKMNESAAEDKGKLEEQLKNITESAGSLQKEASNLANALHGGKGDKKRQGLWGEKRLVDTLRMSGLDESNYQMQETLKDEWNERHIPDCIINMTDDKKIIIDAKASLGSYIDYCNAETELEKQAQLAKLVAATKERINELSSKEYQDKLKEKSIDFVYMFIPEEDILFAVMGKDSSIVEYALERKVSIITPLLLLSMMRIVDRIITIGNQERIIGEVMDMVNNLSKESDRFKSDLEEIGKGLGKAQVAYDSSYNRLAADGGRSIIGRIEKIKSKSRNKKLIALTTEDGDDE